MRVLWQIKPLNPRERESGIGKMAKELREKLIGHLNTIHETLQLFDQTVSSSLGKVSWNDVLQMSDHVSKQATIVGMLWTGQVPEEKSVADTMDSYFNALQGFLLLCHGSTVGAGPTLTSSIHASVKRIVDSSFKLLQGSVSLYEGSYEEDRKPSIPQLVGAVWEACSALKRAPATNIIAIGRAMTQVAVSVKDVLREVKELKPASSSLTDEASDDTKKPENGSQDIENSDDDDLGNDLSAEEMEVAKLAINVVSETLVVIKELIRAITGLIKLENPNDSGKFVDTLENLLKLCQGIGAQIDELGACLYPPLEIATMKKAIETVSRNVDELELELKSFAVSSEPFTQACKMLLGSLKHFFAELDRLNTAEVVAKMQNIAVGD